MSHKVQTEHIVETNKSLISFQRQRMQQTPFKWMLEVEDILDISNMVMRELVSR